MYVGVYNVCRSQMYDDSITKAGREEMTFDSYVLVL